MNYLSTRDSSIKVSAATAIAQGISAEGGLFLPETVPTLTEDDFTALTAMSYPERAKFILSRFLTDFSDDELDHCVKAAYLGTFEQDQPAPLRKAGNAEMLELWHGPTCAFKDLALQLLPQLMTVAVKKTTGAETVILVATSGDTGKAALEGFCDVPGTKILVFYPNDGVSAMQKRQMCTQKGNNVAVFGLHGNFDDAQTGVKQIFTDPALCERLARAGYRFSSANSINWGRLVPQIVYYVSAYCDLLAEKQNLENGFHVVVPTGNFGNILAAYYAKQMGVPIAKLICASNENNVLTDFIRTGVYDKNRAFHVTSSPSMDILVSSNLERLVYLLYHGDAAENCRLQTQLKEQGRYMVSPEVLKRLQSDFEAGCCNDAETFATIRKYYEEYGYLCDTHTAVALHVYDDYVARTGDSTPTVVASTASPYKFAPAVLTAIGCPVPDGDDFGAVKSLAEHTGLPVPSSLAALANAEIRFSEVCEKEEMADAITGFLKI